MYPETLWGSLIGYQSGPLVHVQSQSQIIVSLGVVKVMVCCHMLPKHYLNRWPLIDVLPGDVLLYILLTHWGRDKWTPFADDIFKCISLNEIIWIPIKISPKFVPKGPINNIPAMVQIMAWRRPGDKPLSETMMVSLPTHRCVARPQSVNINR